MCARIIAARFHADKGMRAEASPLELRMGRWATDEARFDELVHED